jgi:hypothetical protein
VSGGSAVYVAAYSLFYFMTKLEIDEFVPTLLYFSYTLIMVITFWYVVVTFVLRKKSNWISGSFGKKVSGACPLKG